MANALSLALPLMLLCLLLPAAGVLRIAFSHPPRGKLEIPGVGFGGQGEEATLLALAPLPWLLLAPLKGDCVWSSPVPQGLAFKASE